MQTILYLSLLLVLVASQCPNNCQLCTRPQTCSLCQPSFALLTSGGCIQKIVPNCRVYASASLCQTCEATFKMVGGQCIKDLSGCVSRSLEGTCMACQFGTQRKGNQCSGVLNCLQYVSSGVCRRCFNGFVVQTGFCVQKRPECVRTTSGVCNSCQQGYILNGFTCLPSGMLPPNCELYDSIKGYCLVCNQGYQMHHRFCQRIDLIVPMGDISQPATQNALQMPTDVLDGGPTVTASKSTGKDNLLSYPMGVKIFAFGSVVKSIPNDPCWIRNGGLCTVCRQGYNLFGGQCRPLPASCLKYSRDGKECLDCNPVLTLQAGRCVDINCAIGIFSRCTLCLQATFQPNPQGICMNDECLQMIAGICRKCSQGFTLDSSNLCKQPSTQTIPPQPIPTQPTSSATTSTIKNCDVVSNGVCTSCTTSFFPDGSGGCKRVIVGCLEMDKANQKCIKCMQIYTLDSLGQCVFVEPVPVAVVPAVALPPQDPFPLDPNCQLQNKGSCAICNQGFILNPSNFSCIQISKQCQTSNTTTGECISCIFGFNLFLGWCLPPTRTKDPNCLISNINNYCIKCQTAFYSLKGICFSNNPLCMTTQYRGGNCLSCYNGYFLFNGQCLQPKNQPACLQYDFQAICIQCRNRFFLMAGICNPVNPLCINYHPDTGVCLDCVSGYGLSVTNSQCLPVRPSPPNCANADQTGTCLSCVSRYYLDSTGACFPVAPLCQNFNSKGGKCQNCFPGFQLLSDSTCLKQSLILGCTSATTKGLCSSCLPQYVLSVDGNCVSRDPSCMVYDWAVCTECKPFYFISQGICKKASPKSKDPNCRINDLYNYCQTCNVGYFVFEGNCRLVDQLCKTSDPNNGQCKSCYEGYRLNKGRCYLNTPIRNCLVFNGPICKQCQLTYTIQPDGSCAL